MAQNPHIWQNSSTAVVSWEVAPKSNVVANEGYIKAYLQLSGMSQTSVHKKGRQHSKSHQIVFLAQSIA